MRLDHFLSLNGLASWSGVTANHLKPQSDADITKVLLAQFK
jgi:hypothetical protein